MKNVYFILIFISTASFAQISVSTLTPTFKGSGGVTIDLNGNVYIADFGDFLGGPDTDGIPNNVMKLDTDLNLTVFANDFTGASGNEFDSNGVLYQADIRDNAIYRIVDGSRVFVTSDGIVAPVGIAFDSSDNLYVCNCGNSTIRKVTPEGVSTLFSSGFFACPNGMTIDENDNLYVVNFSNPNIIKITPDGTASIIGSTIDGNGHIDYDVHTNNLYIASFGGNQIFYLNLDTLNSDVIAGTGTAGNDDGDALTTATFSAPNGIAVSNDGDSIYINSSATLDNNNLNPQYVRVLTNVLDTFLSLEAFEFSANSVKAYPNPAKDELTIESKLLTNTANLSIKVLDTEGRVINHIKIVNLENPFQLNLDISTLQSGIYFYDIMKQNTSVYKGKFIKK